MEIAPDTKDWTWVLDRPCEDCGLDTTAVAAQDVAAILRTSATAWGDVLRRDDAGLRPDPTTWSPLEYACHVRDVCLRFDARTELMLTHEDPTFENWDQDATAVQAGYRDQDPAVAAAELAEAAHTFAAHLDALTEVQWQRTGRRSDGARFTVDSFARYFIHDVVHHLHDVAAPTAP